MGKMLSILEMCFQDTGLHFGSSQAGKCASAPGAWLDTDVELIVLGSLPQSARGRSIVREASSSRADGRP